MVNFFLSNSFPFPNMPGTAVLPYNTDQESGKVSPRYKNTPPFHPPSYHILAGVIFPLRGLVPMGHFVGSRFFVIL